MKTILNITHPITLSHHGSYKYLNKQMLRFTTWLEENKEEVLKHFTLRPEIEIRLRPLPRRRKSGSGGRGKVELDVSQGLRSMVETLCHELTHEEQYFEGRLVNFNRKTAEWSGQLMKVYWPGSCKRAHERYEALPWEVEARERAAAAMVVLEKVLGKIPNDVV